MNHRDSASDLRMTSMVTAASNLTGIVRKPYKIDYNENPLDIKYKQECDTLSEEFDEENDDFEDLPVNDKSLRPAIRNIKHMRCGLWKRKNCMMKKASILAQHFDQHVFLAFLDPRLRKLSLYSSNDDFCHKSV